MKWSLRIGRLFGVDISVHWTLLLLLAWVGGSYLLHGGWIEATITGTTFVLGIFASVALHECGHLLLARRYGVEIRDVTLLPIGGVPGLREVPERAIGELIVAVAGPAVNVVIAVVLGAVLLGAGGLAVLLPEEFSLPEQVVQQQFAGIGLNLMWFNVFLVVFNALPALPMDGGRVLRALLSKAMDRGRATNLVAAFGQSLAMLIGVLGLFTYDPLLLFIAIFVYVGADAELRMIRTTTMLRDVPLTAAIIEQFRVLHARDTLAAARDELLDGSQQDFPVLEDGHLVGMLFRNDLIEALKAWGPDVAVEEVMNRDVLRLDPAHSVHEAMQMMQDRGHSSLAVVDGERLLGIVTSENIGELLMLREAEENYAVLHPQEQVRLVRQEPERTS